MGDELNFNFDENEEVFEDISSNTESVQDDNDMFVSDIGGKHAKAKKRGKFGNWWHSLSRGKRALSITGCVIFLLVAIILINPFHVLEHILYNFDNITDNSEEYGFETKIDEDIINIALFGIDTRKPNTFTGNSDSIMILSINTKLKAVKIMSVMRDTISPIYRTNGKMRYGKINSAYANSPQTAIRTLNEVFDLDISEYAVVNFYGMSEIIDAVGGIDIDVTADELKDHGRVHLNLNRCIKEICKNLKKNPSKYYIHTTGKHHVNGIQAVAYSRIRCAVNVWGTNNDYGRTDRQRYVMEQLFNKALKIKKSDYAKLAKSLIPCTQTSLELNRILSIAYNVMLESPTFYQARIPQENWLMKFRWSRYGSVVYYDLDFASRAIHSVIYENKTIEEFVEINGVEKNDWFASTGTYSSSNKNSSSKAATSSVKTSSKVTSSKAASSVASAAKPVESVPDDTSSDIQSDNTSSTQSDTASSTQSDTASEATVP